MATQALNADRRSFLAAGAATIVAVSVAAPVMAASPCAEWDAALAAYRSAESAMIADDYSDASSDAFLERKFELWDTPAPDRAALRWKLDDVLEPAVDDDESPAWNKDRLRQIYADIARLLGDA